MINENKSVKDLWNSYLDENPKIDSDTPYTSWYFCDNEKSANELLKLVLNGEKKGTTSLNKSYEPNEEKPKVNDYSIITNFYGEAKCIIKTMKIKKLPFDEVTEEMAYLEGEGNKTLDYWRKVHRNFFSDYCNSVGKIFSEKNLVIYEHFEVIYKK